MKNTTAYFEVKDYTNDELRDLLKEVYKIGNAEKPAHVEQSEKMKYLFSLEKKDFNMWLDVYHHVRHSIEFEILHRINTNLF